MSERELQERIKREGGREGRKGRECLPISTATRSIIKREIISNLFLKIKTIINVKRKK